jgi:SP family arabinose:H+ symporter-like MFS transporter
VEISATQWRGQIITAFKVANTAGALVSSLVWLIIPTSMFQMPFYIALTLSIFICLLILVLPESPRWLIFNNKIAAAKAILARVYKDENQAQVLVNEICASANSIKTNVWKELFSKSSIFPFLAVLAVVSLSQLTGIIVFIQNSIQILKDCGINSPIIGIYGMIAINGINFVALLLTMLLIEKIGRRLILMIGTIGVFVSLVTLAMLHYFLLPGLLLGYITLCGIVLVVGFFAFGPSGIVLVISTELLPNRVRGLAISIAFTFGALVGTIFVSWFGKLSSQIGYANLFLIMSGFALCYFITAYLIPETKGKDLEKISWQDKKA